jgi:heme/copper-type cytochrome/quinol oxidase subunit 3
MTSAQYPAAEVQPIHSLGWSGMVWVILTEASLFAFLLFSYFYLATLAPTWPPGTPPALGLATANTIILLSSSGTMWLADRAGRRRLKGRVKASLFISFVLGGLFLGIQAVELGRRMRAPGHHAYDSLVFTILCFHGAHVLAGLIMNAVVQAQLWLTRSRGVLRRVPTITLYWHFVDIVWLVVFSSLYLASRIG